MTTDTPNTTEVYRLVGQQIRKERIQRHITQEELGDRVGLKRTSITNIEKGRQKMLLHTLFEISEALGVTLETLLAPLSQQNQPLEVEGLPPHLTASVKNWILAGVASVRKPSRK